MTTDVYILLADGFEEAEALVPTDYFRRAELPTKLVSTMDQIQVTGSHGITVTADVSLDEVDPKIAAAVILPGGLPGATNLRDNPKVIELIQAVNQNQQIVAAICAAPIVLQKAGLLAGKTGTCYPGFEDELDLAKWVPGVHRDENIITGEGPAFAPYFAFEIIRAIIPHRLPALKSGLLMDDLNKYLAGNL